MVVLPEGDRDALKSPVGFEVVPANKGPISVPTVLRDENLRDLSIGISHLSFSNDGSYLAIYNGNSCVTF